MNIATIILSVLTSLLMISCRDAGEKETVVSGKGDTAVAAADGIEEARGEKRREVEDRARHDSIHDSKALKEAIQVVEQYRGEEVFDKAYVVTLEDSSYQVKVSISSAYYFSNSFPHLIIRRETPNNNYIDIFVRKDGSLERVLAHEQWSMEYTGDTIGDMNGDGIKDFTVNWYGSSGCCLKSFSNVYLLREDRKSFTGSFEFTNPTFSPKEQVIRGVRYGHPGETEMYKYKWNGERVDTLGYLSFEKNSQGGKTGKLMLTDKLPYGSRFKVLKRLNNVPAEYRRIYGYDWFIGNLN